MPVEIGNYCGVFDNPNQLGRAALLFVAAVLVVFCSVKRRTQSKRIALVSLVAALGGTTLVVLSVSRGAAATLVAVVVVALWCSAVAPSMFVRPLWVIGGTVAMAGVLLVSLSETQLDLLSRAIDNVVTKQNKSLEQGDIFNGRGDMWSDTFAELAPFGHGSSYFLNEFDKGAHNSVVDLLGKEGPASAALFLCIGVFNIVLAGRYFRRHYASNPYAAAPLIMSTVFWGCSASEGMLGASGQMATQMYFIVTGIVVADVD